MADANEAAQVPEATRAHESEQTPAVALASDTEAAGPLAVVSREPDSTTGEPAAPMPTASPDASVGAEATIEGNASERVVSSAVPPASVKQKRWLVIGAVLVALIGSALLATRACGSKHASSPRRSSVSPVIVPVVQQDAQRAKQQAEKNPEPTPPRNEPEASVAVAPEPAVDQVASKVEEAKIQVVVKPDGTQFRYKGKVVGRTPFVLKQPRDEKRTYEIVKAGYSPRRLVVTGNERIIGFQMQQDVPHPDSL